MPVQVKTLCLYAHFLSRSFNSVHSVRNYLSAVKTLHSLLELIYPDTDLMQLKLLLRGLACSKQHVPKQASPITQKILTDMFSFVDLQIEFDIVSWSITLLLFFLMTRKSSFLPTSVKDIEVFEDLLVININWSKTRRFGHSRQDLVPVLAIPDSCLCPKCDFFNFSDSFFADQLNLENENRFDPLANGSGTKPFKLVQIKTKSLD